MKLFYLLRGWSSRACLAGVITWQLSLSAMASEVDYVRDVRPILSNNCFACHGADAGSRKAELRLDRREDAVRERDGIAAIVPGNFDDSELYLRITATDDVGRMPPKSSHKTLTPQQIGTLKLWIEQGAPYAGHWAFEPVRRPAVPSMKEVSPAGGSPATVWGRNAIDAFIARKLATQQLLPSPEANRATLIRRLYQDLLGLLPSPEEVDRFVGDQAPDAYETLVDRLLENPHYGERWGRYWLDQARYADSNGYTIDSARIMWPYRDWVIHSLNADLPFDQFTIEQLAGDLLEHPTKQQLVATAFHRNTMINQEGGVKPDQYRHEAVVDRVSTTATVWLGLTVGCAQCHSHKFDPISHDEYYRMYAFFNRCEDSNNVGPTVKVYQGEIFGLSAEQLNTIAELKQRRTELAKLAVKAKQVAGARLGGVEWNWQPVEFLDFRTEGNASFRRLEDGSLLSDRQATENDSYTVRFKPQLDRVAAIRLRVLPHDSLPMNGPGLASNGNFVLTDITLKLDGNSQRFAEAWADHQQPSYEVSHAIDNNRRSGWAINVPADQPATAKPKMNSPHEAVFVFPKPVDMRGKVATVVLRHDLNENYLIGRFAVDVSEVPAPAAVDGTSQDLADLKQEIAKLEKQVPGQGTPVAQMISREQSKPPVTFVLQRGNFLTPDIEHGAMSPGVPEILLQGNSPRFNNRLDLARWLVSRDNPLTARVAVNRVWMRYFGRGLVETEDDFGLQGTPPSHPDLLDWLASEFMDHGWSLKSLHRLIVISATYRQSSQQREDLANIDPDNRLLARQSRLRVDAEVVRDLALSASGALSHRVGGPSVFPPQPAGVYSFTQSAKPWPESQGNDRYRRTLYTMFYRSAPYPLFRTFDAPDFSTVCTRRPRSNTPLQSLTLANDPVFVELAGILAGRVLRDSRPVADLDEQLTFLFRLCLSRRPAPTELNLLAKYWRDEYQRYRQNSEAAEKVAAGVQSPAGKDKKATGAAGKPAVVEPAIRAAWASLARVLLNTDEFITRN